ncbi:organic cation transporter protein-like [Mytilus galloprovincialis]|uniref:organic cation transporter protein-like n=1 Tax=Mytilus galloprovincialis TaxID=29158 RepID=UPI003F7B4E62
MSEYEAVLKQLGSYGPLHYFGKYQFRVFIIVSLFETPAAWAMLLPILINAKPTWTCYEDNGNATRNMTQNYTMNACAADNKMCAAMKFSEDFTSIISEWHLICENEGIPSLITTIQMLGVFLGACITGQLADKFGRKKPLYLEYLLLLILLFCSAFAQSWQTFAVLRFFIGGLVGGVLVTNFVLPLEYVIPSWRVFCGCVGFWAVGLMLLAPLGYLIRDWRTLTMVTSLVGLPMLLSWRLVPESPRWLLSKGRYEEAKQIILTMAAYNKVDNPDLTQLQLSMKIDRNENKGCQMYSYHNLCRNPKSAFHSFIAMFSWFVSSSVYYGLNFNTKNLAGDRYLNIFISGLVEIPALVLVLLISNKIGRRKTISVLMMLAGISCFSVLFIDLAVSGEKSSGLTILTIVLAMLGKSGIAGGWAAVQVFSAETFPTVVRNIGIAACSMSARVGGVVAPQFESLNSIQQSLPFTIFGGLALACGILVCFLPETAGRPLPDKLDIDVMVEAPLNDKREKAVGEVLEDTPLQNDYEQENVL